jgi:putative N6-adenine-specific DNA methylase
VERYRLAAAAGFGLEAVVAAELLALGLTGPRAENGKVMFDGTADDLARCSLWLRSADRLLVWLAEFSAADFDQLYEGVRAIPWGDFMAPEPRVVVTARSSRSALTATPAIQSVAKKAIVDSLARGRPRVEETGPLYPVDIALSRDRATVTLDASGDGLHKRGYRTEAGRAPLRETLAAGLLLLSRWDASRPLADPLCGSGTIPIEAALIGANIPAGARRSFLAEQWPHIPAAAWSRAREEAAALRRRPELRISASDRDGAVLAAARRNAGRAGVAGSIRFSVADLADSRPEGEYGCIVTNPPYAERLGEKREVEELYRRLGALFRGLPTWSLFALSAHPGFERHFGGNASRNRKLYNGNLRCYCYQYFGPLPPRTTPDGGSGREGAPGQEAGPA